MKTCLKKLFLLPALSAALALTLTGRVTAQTFANLYNFSAFIPPNYTNSDGYLPTGSLLLLGNTLYGAAGDGGANGNGTLFAINTNGAGFTNLHSFSAGATNAVGHFTNSDGTGPPGSLILSGNNLYGTAHAGGPNGTNGTVFAINTNGTGFTILYRFSAGAANALGHVTNSDGATPYSGLTLSGNTLYGTACYGGANGYGTVFAINTNGAGFTNLHTFTTLVSSNNSDGANPYAGLLLSGNTLYGTTQAGGTNGTGTLFALNTDGTSFTTLHHFSAGATNAQGQYTNGDGAFTRARLILSGNTLYGAGSFGGPNGWGTVFTLNTNGTDFTNLHVFSAGAVNANFVYTNSDGAYPQSGVILSGNTLYGAGSFASSQGTGNIFSLHTNGGSFTVLMTFAAESFDAPLEAEVNSNGAYPQSPLLLSGNTLYGTAPLGALNGSGTLFSISPVSVSVSQPQLSIMRSGTNVILTWPANAAGFTLQSTTNLASPALWAAVSPAPVLANGQNTVTNLISAAQQFFRLAN